MGLNIQSGKVENFTTAGSDWYQVVFKTPFDATSNVIINAQIQTYAGVDTPGLRLQNVSPLGFEVCMKELRESYASSSVVGDLGTFKGSGTHPNAETLGWVAISLD